MTSLNQPNRYTAMLGNHEITIETGKLAKLAGGAVTVRMGESIVLVTATAAKEPREGINFFPLSVDFEERMYAAGRIPGSFFRREGRPSESGILLSRLVDRGLRPSSPRATATTCRSSSPPSATMTSPRSTPLRPSVPAPPS